MEAGSKQQPGWIRGAQLGLGAVIIILSLLIIFNPVITTVTLVFLLGIALLFLGIERVITAIFLSKTSRLGTIGLGIICIIFAILFMTFPQGSTTTLVIIAAIALLFGGIAKLFEGLRRRERGRLHRWSSVGVGALALAVAITIFVVPGFGIGLVGVIFGIVLIIMGIQIIYAGITGRHRMLKLK
ncbi:MAG TPA: DUF308 domain-containing protein [Nitrososphaeraceae archaeon]|jgi:uncharacterized membrane protein HdeD (DUF308 family)